MIKYLFLGIMLLIIIIYTYIHWMKYKFIKKEFNIEFWNSFKEKRYLLVGYLIKNNILLNMSKIEVKCFLGDELNDDNDCYWRYYIGNKTGFSKGYLHVLFDDDNRVFKVLKN